MPFGNELITHYSNLNNVAKIAKDNLARFTWDYCADPDELLLLDQSTFVAGSGITSIDWVVEALNVTPLTGTSAAGFMSIDTSTLPKDGTEWRIDYTVNFTNGEIDHKFVFFNPTIDADTKGCSDPNTEPLRDKTVSADASRPTIFEGVYDIIANTPDLLTPVTGAVNRGFQYQVVNGPGTFFGELLETGDMMTAKVDDPAGVNDWAFVQANLDSALLPTQNEKDAMTNATAPTAGNPFVTVSALPAANGLAATLVIGNTTGGTNIVTTTTDAIQLGGTTDFGIFRGLSQHGDTGVIFDFFDSGDDMFFYLDGANFQFKFGNILSQGVQAAQVAFFENQIYNAADRVTIVAPAAVTGARLQTLQDADGVIALLSDIGGSETLAATLIAGNTSGANDILMDTTQRIRFNVSNHSIWGGDTNVLSIAGNKAVSLSYQGGSADFGTGAISLTDTTQSTLMLINYDASGNIVWNDGTFQGTLQWPVLAANRVWTMPDATGTIALTGNVLKDKAGIVLPASFALSAGVYKATITFSTAFSDASYAPVVTGSDIRTWSIESKVAGSFIINSGSAVAPVGDTFWIAKKTGEAL